MALVLLVAIPWFAFAVRRDRAAPLVLRASASALLSLLFLQILLGMQIIVTFRRAGVTTSHVGVGALMLALVFWTTWVAHRDRIEGRPAS